METENKKMDIKHIGVDFVNAYYAEKSKQHDTNDEIEFECPNCHSIAKGWTEPTMGHPRIWCEGCGLKVFA